MVEKPAMAHDAWLVDLDGTLYSAAPVKLMMATEVITFGRHAIPTLRQFRLQHELLRENPPDALDPYRTQLERTAKAVERDLEEVAALVKEWMHVRPGRWIRLFRRRGLLEEIAAHSRRIKEIPPEDR